MGERHLFGMQGEHAHAGAHLHVIDGSFGQGLATAGIPGFEESPGIGHDR